MNIKTLPCQNMWDVAKTIFIGKSIAFKYLHYKRRNNLIFLNFSLGNG